MSEKTAKTKSVDLSDTLEDLRKRIEKLENVVYGRPDLMKDARSTPTLDFDFSQLSYLRELKSTPDKCLAILDHAFAKDPDHAGFTSTEIDEILRERFGLSIPLPTVSKSLMTMAGRLVTRTRIEGRPVTYRYSILLSGQEKIEKKIAELKTGK